MSACTVPHQVARDFARDTNDSGLLFKITQLQQIAELTLDVAGLERLKRSALKQAKMSDRRISQTQLDKVNAVGTKVKALRELHTSNDTVLNSDRAIPTLDSLCDPAPVRDRCLEEAVRITTEFSDSWARDMRMLLNELQALVLPELQHNRKDEFLEDEVLRTALLAGQPQKAKKLAVFAKEVTTQSKFWRLSKAMVPQHLAIKESAMKLAESWVADRPDGLGVRAEGHERSTIQAALGKSG